MVLTELLNFASRQGEYLQRLAGETARQRYHEPSLEVIRQTTGLFQEALERYLTRPDQGWSLVDCASFVVMETLRTREAPAFYSHSEKVGFTAQLRD